MNNVVKLLTAQLNNVDNLSTNMTSVFNGDIAELNNINDFLTNDDKELKILMKSDSKESSLMSDSKTPLISDSKVSGPPSIVTDREQLGGNCSRKTYKNRKHRKKGKYSKRTRGGYIYSKKSHK